jgi:hypothetical protein
MKNNQTMLHCISLCPFYFIHNNHPSEAFTTANMEVGGRDRMVVGFITTYAISAYHH